jgi:hypothetical protein
MPRSESIYTEKDNSLPEPLKIYRTTKPLVQPIEEDTNCCTNGTFCWNLFRICGLCERCGKY